MSFQFIDNGDFRSFTLVQTGRGDTPFQKGILGIRPIDLPNSPTVTEGAEIYYYSNPLMPIVTQPVDNFLDDVGTPFATYAALETYLSSFFF